MYVVILCASIITEYANDMYRAAFNGRQRAVTANGCTHRKILHLDIFTLVAC